MGDKSVFIFDVYFEESDDIQIGVLAMTKNEAIDRLIGAYDNNSFLIGFEFVDSYSVIDEPKPE